MKLSTIAVDTDKAENGIWKELVVGMGFECLIARHNNSRFRAEIERRVVDISRDKNREPTAAEYSEATLRSLCSKVLLNWRGLEDDDDQPIPYSPEKAYEILSDPEYADLRDAVEEISGSQKEYRRVQNLGNSQGSSDGGLKTKKTTTGTSAVSVEG